VYIRVAAIARKVFLRRNIGVEKLRHFYGGKDRKGR